MWRLLYLISVVQICNEILPLVQHLIITSGTVYDVSYLYAVFIEHDVISDFIVIVNSFFILSDVISISLLFLNLFIPNPP